MILKGDIFSKVLEMETGVTIIAPNDIKTDDNYKVVYLLHGLCGSSGDLVNYTMLPAYASDYDAIFILPEVTRSFYTDMQYGLKYFSYITDELPLICESIFNISSKRKDTAVMGVSMGGYGALKSALSKPEQYGFCGAISPGCLFLKDFLSEMKEKGYEKEFVKIWGQQFITDFRAAFGENLEWKPEYEIMELAKMINENSSKPVIYATCGTEDGLLTINQQLNKEMKQLDLDFTYEECSGTHNWYFFNDAIKRALNKWYRKQ